MREDLLRRGGAWLAGAGIVWLISRLGDNTATVLLAGALAVVGLAYVVLGLVG